MLSASLMTMMPAAHAASGRGACQSTSPGAQEYSTSLKALGFVPTPPSRILDTRTGNGVSSACRVVSGTHLSLKVTGRGGVPTAGVAAVTLNITGTGATGTSWIAAYPGGTKFLDTSTVNLLRGVDAASLVTVPVGADGTVNLAVGGASMDAVVDVLGYFPTDGSGDRYEPVKPKRLYDHHMETREWDSISTGISGASALVVNTTIDRPRGDMFFSVSDQKYAGGSPQFSNINVSHGLTRTNRAVVSGSERLGVFASQYARSIVDITGKFAKDGSQGYTPMAPRRVLDTRREGGKLPSGVTTISFEDVLPADAEAIVATFTAVDTSNPSYMTFYQGGGPKNATSDLNMNRWDARSNMAIVPLGPGKTINSYLNTGSTHLIVDVLGYFSKEEAVSGPTPTPTPEPTSGDDPTDAPSGPSTDPAKLNTRFTAAPENGTVTSTRNISFSVTANGASGYQCSVDFTSYKVCGANFTAQNLGPGDHTIAIRALNNLGQPDPTPAVRHVRVKGRVGEVKPSGSTTGVPRGKSLRRHDGNLTITQAGTVIDGLDIHGFVTVKAPNVTIRRSIVRGGVATNNKGLIMNYDPAATNTIVEDVTIKPSNPSAYLDGLKGMNIHAERVDISGTVDGAGFHGDNNSIVNSWIHGMSTYETGHYPGAQIPSHNDGIQIHGGHGNYFAGNVIQHGSNAAIMVTQDYTKTSNLTISRNWMDNGGCTVNIHHKNRGPMSGIVVSDNRFGRSTRVSNCAIIATRDSRVSAHGNVYTDGQVAAVRNGG